MMPAAMLRRRVPLLIAAAGLSGLVAACGTEAISPQISKQSANIQHGAQLFSDRCSGCHNLDVVGAQGGAQKVKDRERTDGPNFNVRHEDVDSVLYAIRNGGFSGAIMPENVVVGQDARDVAAFLSKYAGRGKNAAATPSSPGPQPGSQPPASQGETGGGS
jgi:mono/diheme cytochrome c family protein